MRADVSVVAQIRAAVILRQRATAAASESVTRVVGNRNVIARAEVARASSSSTNTTGLVGFTSDTDRSVWAAPRVGRAVGGYAPRRTALDHRTAAAPRHRHGSSAAPSP